MQISMLKTALLAMLLVVPTASRLRAGDDPAPTPRAKKEKKIIGASPEKEIVVDGDRVFLWGDDEGLDSISGLDDMQDVDLDLEDLPRSMRFHGRLGGGSIGLRPIEMTPELREHFGAPKEAGVFVGSVEKDGPAAKAGLRVGDIVTAVDGDKIDSTRELIHAVRRKKDGEIVTVDVLRDRAARTVRVAVVERKEKEIRLGDLGHRMRRLRFDHGVPPVPPVPPVAPAPPAPPMSPSYGDLQQRMRTLEQRLEQLEGRRPSQ